MTELIEKQLQLLCVIQFAFTIIAMGCAFLMGYFYRAMKEEERKINDESNR